MCSVCICALLHPHMHVCLCCVCAFTIAGAPVYHCVPCLSVHLYTTGSSVCVSYVCVYTTRSNVCVFMCVSAAFVCLSLFPLCMFALLNSTYAQYNGQSLTSVWFLGGNFGILLQQCYHWRQSSSECCFLSNPEHTSKHQVMEGEHRIWSKKGSICQPHSMGHSLLFLQQRVFCRDGV